MQKSIKLALNEFHNIPPSLADPHAPGNYVSEIMVDLADLYHHYYLQSFGLAPPNPDPTNFEHVRYLEPCAAFRFQKHGLGANKTKKQNNSNELGEAFCRWFLDSHLDISHVARIDDVRDHGALAWANGVKVESHENVEGDAPDYFCVDSYGRISLAEAKGTITAVGFGTKMFQTWRDQFKRIRVLDSNGKSMSVKGYIVAMRWAVHPQSPNIFTKLACEDPKTQGERPFFDESGGFAAAVRSLHYAPSLARLRQPVLSAALSDGSTIPDELQFQVVMWESFLPKLKGLRFAGGFYPGDPAGVPPFLFEGGNVVTSPANPLRLDQSSGTFVGIEENIFRRLVDTARVGPLAINRIELLSVDATGYSGASLLRDGHMLGPIELFRPVGFVNL